MRSICTANITLLDMIIRAIFIEGLKQTYLKPRAITCTVTVTEWSHKATLALRPFMIVVQPHLSPNYPDLSATALLEITSRDI